MKKNKSTILISVFLLAILLVGNFGVHLVHHHEACTETLHVSGSDHQTGDQVYDTDEGCTLCKLDLFQTLYSTASPKFVFFKVEVNNPYRYSQGVKLVSSQFFYGRAPPTLFI